MFRWLLLLVAAALIAAAAAWLAGHPGSVSLEWGGYRIDTSAAVLAAAVVAFAVVLAVLYRCWWTLLRAPRHFLKTQRDRRQKRGYEALSRGLVAVAAGDVETANRQARRASSLLGSPPLTMLLAAQAAQLEGDEKTAETFFAAMTERRDTEFLGVRGLLTQAMKRGDWKRALQLARQAYRLNPKSGWVVSTLYELQRRMGLWTDAEATLREAEKLRLMPPDAVGRQLAEIRYQKSLAGEGSEAVKFARLAYRADPKMVAAARRWAELLVAEGRHRKAASVIESAWERTPDQQLAPVYWRARHVNDTAERLQAAKRLAAHNANHAESRLLVAAAALEARAWSEARGQLEPIADDHAPPAVCRLMARLEEGEHGDLTRAREWLMRATAQEPGSAPQPQLAEPTPARGPGVVPAANAAAS